MDITSIKTVCIKPTAFPAAGQIQNQASSTFLANAMNALLSIIQLIETLFPLDVRGNKVDEKRKIYTDDCNSQRYKPQH